MEILISQITVSKSELFNKNFFALKKNQMTYPYNTMKEDISFHSNPAQYLILLKANVLKAAGSSLSHF